MIIYFLVTNETELPFEPLPLSLIYDKGKSVTVLN